MVAVSYRESVHAPQGPVRSKSFWAALIEKLIESRRLRADIELRRYRHLLPVELELAGNKLDSRTEDQLPFTRG